MVIKTGKIGKRLLSSKVWKNSSKEHSTKNSNNKCLPQPSDMHTNYLHSSTHQSHQRHLADTYHLVYKCSIYMKFELNWIRICWELTTFIWTVPTIPLTRGALGLVRSPLYTFYMATKMSHPYGAFLVWDTFAYSGRNYPHHYQDSHDSQAKSISKTNHYKTNKQTETTQPERSTTIYHYVW